MADNRRIQVLSRSDLQNLIRNGTADGMPPFGSLSATDLEAVTTYVASLSPPDPTSRVEGNVTAGEAFFFGRGQCATCHMAHGRGAAIGPDLSSIGRQMTPAELVTSLTDPNAAIARGYSMASAQPKEGRTVRGFIRNEGNHVLPLQTLDGRLVLSKKLL
jgi:putative heme-binding domain-containing protein